MLSYRISAAAFFIKYSPAYHKFALGTWVSKKLIQTVFASLIIALVEAKFWNFQLCHFGWCCSHQVPFFLKPLQTLTRYPFNCIQYFLVFNFQTALPSSLTYFPPPPFPLSSIVTFEHIYCTMNFIVYFLT